MKTRKWLALMACLSASVVYAAKQPNFAGTWEFNPGKSKNIGMMAQINMTETIKQTSASIDVTTHTNFQGRESENQNHFDLSGKEVTNSSPMAGPSETVSKWEGDKLVTTWTSAGAVAGTKTVRTETWSLSSDGKTMSVESVRGSNQPVVMVFEKK
jgi:hypothetical protein